MGTDKQLAQGATRVVQLYKAQGNQLMSVETDATTLGELKAALRQQQISYEGLKFIDGDTDATYELDTAMLPQGNFTIFAMPEKQKLGGEWPQDRNYFAATREAQKRIATGRLKHSNFGSLHSSNINHVRAILDDDDAKRTAKKALKGKKSISKSVMTKSVLTKDEVLKTARKKLLKSGYNNSSKIIKQIDRVLCNTRKTSFSNASLDKLKKKAKLLREKI